LKLSQKTLLSKITIQRTTCFHKKLGEIRNTTTITCCCNSGGGVRIRVVEGRDGFNSERDLEGVFVEFCKITAFIFFSSIF